MLDKLFFGNLNPFVFADIIFTWTSNFFLFQVIVSPLYFNDSYKMGDIVPDRNILYSVANSWLGVMIDGLEIAFNVDGRRNKMMKKIRRK